MGVIAPWYLKPFQLEMYEVVANQRFPFIEKSRRIGGTTTNLVYVQEFLRQGEGKIWRWCEPWKYQAREIVMPEMERVQETCPDALKFKFYKTDSFYELPHNGARMYLRGINEDKGESSRGAYAHGITADEYGSWREARYVINEVFLPQLLSTNGQLVRNSSPPRDLGHLYYEDRETASRDGRMISKTILDAVPELYDLKQVTEMCDAVGGPQSAAWLREFLCLPVSDPEMLVCPEYSDTENVVPDDYERPEYFTPYVAGDSGADDNTALLFGYYDFTKDEEIIERELIVNGKTTREIVVLAQAIEKELWGHVPVHRRVYDAPKQLIYDIFTEYKWSVSMPNKADKNAAVHLLRNRIGARKHKIKESCHGYRRQLKVGMWKDERKLDFQRTEGLGHLDAIAAGIYFNRAVDRKLNPIPLNHGLSRETHFIPTHAISRGTTEDAIARLMGSKARNKR